MFLALKDIELHVTDCVTALLQGEQIVLLIHKLFTQICARLTHEILSM